MKASEESGAVDAGAKVEMEVMVKMAMKMGMRAEMGVRSVGAVGLKMEERKVMGWEDRVLVMGKMAD